MARFPRASFFFLLVALCSLAAVAQAQIRSEFVGFPGGSSLFLTQAPGDTTRSFVVRKGGRIEVMDLTTGAVNGTPYIDLSSELPSPLNSGERGLLGLAFHPDFQSNGLFYVNMSAPSTFGGNHDTLVREYTVPVPGSDVANPTSMRTVLRFGQDFTNHNGGWMGFNPIANAANDNSQYLYIAVGDGGNGNDPNNRAQTRTNLLGNMLRIDPTGPDAFVGDPNRNYAIPASNPFFGAGGGIEEEIWAWGLRNPWRNSFDRTTGDLVIADVGQGDYEEINFQLASSTGGENYGWRPREGAQSNPNLGDPNPPNFVDPVYDYTHGGGQFEGFSVTGGYVYRGPVQALQGEYFFGDFVTSRIWSIELDSGTGQMVPGSLTDWTQILNGDSGNTISNISSFGEDNVGNLYVVTNGGAVFSIVPEPSTYALALAGLVIAGIFAVRYGTLGVR